MNKESNSDKAQLHQVFVQANLIKGYRYLDLSGVVLNRIADLYKEFSIDPNGALLKTPKDVKDPHALRFSVDRIWVQYAPIKSLKYVIDTAPEWIEGISKDIGVSRFNRLGLRAQYFMPCKNIIKSSTILSKKISGDIFQDMLADVDDKEDADLNYRVRIPIKDFIALIRVSIVRIERDAREPGDFPSDGFIYDMDIYRRRTSPDWLPRAETRGFLKSAADIVYDLLEKGYSLMEVCNGTNSSI